MINFKLKSKTPELQAFAKLLIVTLDNACQADIISHENYYHYYNILSLIKRLQIKSFASMKQTQTVNVNCNEWESVKFLFALYQKELEEHYYSFYINTDVSMQMSKQQRNLTVPKCFS